MAGVGKRRGHEQQRSFGTQATSDHDGAVNQNLDILFAV